MFNLSNDFQIVLLFLSDLRILQRCLQLTKRVCLCVYVCVYLEDRQKGNERKTVPPMGEEFRGKWRHVYVWLTPLAVHLKLPQ